MLHKTLHCTTPKELELELELNLELEVLMWIKEHLYFILTLCCLNIFYNILLGNVIMKSGMHICVFLRLL